MRRTDLGPRQGRDHAGVWWLPLLRTLSEASCDVVVIGSTARQLSGQPVTPADLDLLVPDEPNAQRHVATVLAGLGGLVARGPRLCPFDEVVLPWPWVFTVVTAYGNVDVMSRFANGDSHASLAPTARAVVVDDLTVQCWIPEDACHG